MAQRTGLNCLSNEDVSLSLQVDKNTVKTGSMLRTILDGVFIAVACFLGYLTAHYGVDALIPVSLTVFALLVLRLGIGAPFNRTMVFYLAMVAFNYYYFYCSAIYGRNPTDVAVLPGKMATPMEQIQKDIFFFAILSIGLLKLLDFKMENRPLLAKRLSHPMVRIILITMIYSIFRALFQVFEGETLFKTFAFLRMYTEFAVIPLLFCTSLIRNEKDLRSIYKGMFYTLGIVAVLGIVEFFIEGSPYVKSFYGGRWLHRSVSTMQNPNNLGCYLATTMGVFILYFYRNQLRMWERNLFWLSMPLGFACLFMTLSRSAIITFFIALTISFTGLFFTAEREMGRQHMKVCRNLMVSYILTLSISLFVLYKFFDFNNAVKDAAEMYLQNSVVSNMRTFALFSSFKVIVESPLGLIFGYSESVYKRLPDNGFALVLISSGIVGFLLHMSLWFYAFKTCIQRVFDKVKIHSFLYTVCLYVLTFQFIFNFSNNLIRAFPQNLYFWLTIGVIVWLESKPVKASDTEEAPDAPPIPIAAMLPPFFPQPKPTAAKPPATAKDDPVQPIPPQG